MNLGKYYLTASLFSASRMGIGATSVLYMLSFGVSLGDIAVIKIIQALVIFFAEVPTGIVADRFGRRVSLMLACLMAIVSFLCFIFFTNIVGFSVAEIFNALAISFWSGAFEALAVDNTQADKAKKGFIEYFFAKISKYTSIAVMVAGLIGGLLGDLHLVYPFYFSMALMGLSLAFILFSLEERSLDLTINSHQNIKPQNNGLLRDLSLLSRLYNVFGTMQAHMKNAFKYALSQKMIRRFFLIQIAIQFALQPVFHYWQPYFKSFGDQATVSLMGYIFFAYVFTQTLFSWAVASLFGKEKTSAEMINWTSCLITLLCFIGLYVSQNLYVAITIFCVLQGSVNVFRNNIGAGFNRYIPSAERGTILSSVSFISRIGMFAHLLLLKFTTQIIPLNYAYLASAMGFSMVVYLLFGWQTAPVKSCEVQKNPQFLPKASKIEARA